MKEFPIYYLTANKLADYYSVGAHKQVTVSIRAESGKYLCHTCCANKCEHIDAVRAHVEQFGVPVIEALPREATQPVTMDLTWVEL